MKQRRLVVGSISFALMAWSLVAYAAATDWGIVTHVRAGYADGHVALGGLSNAAGCSSDTIEFHPSTSNPEAVQSLATAALLSGKELKCYVDGCNVNGTQKGVACWLRR